MDDITILIIVNSRACSGELLRRLSEGSSKADWQSYPCRKDGRLLSTLRFRLGGGWSQRDDTC